MKDKCPLCQGDHVSVFLTLHREKCPRSSYGVAHQKQRIMKCERCRLLFSDRAYRPVDALVYYGKEYHEKMSGSFDSDYSAGTYRQFLRRLALIGLYVGKGRILDIGCSTGCFLSLCKKAGFEVRGVEPSAEAVRICQEKVPAFEDAIENEDIEKSKILTADTYDVITLWDVIEHIPSLENAIPKIMHSLKNNGILAIRTPDSDSLFFKIALFLKKMTFSGYEDPLYALFHADHFLYFNETALKYFAGKYHLEIVKLIPDPLLWKKFRESELNRGFFANTAIAAVYWLGRAMGKGHGLIMIARKTKSSERERGGLLESVQTGK